MNEHHTSYTISSTPHIRSNETIESVMKDVLIALIPATLFGIHLFGMQAAIVIFLAVAAAVASEYAYQKICKKPLTIGDYSAAVTGLLLALNLPPAVPYYVPVLGSVFAIIIVKQLFGGLGQNFVNPALAARAMLMTSYPTAMTTFTLDGVTTSTPLYFLKNEGLNPSAADYMNALMGNIGGCIGETCVIAILLGGGYLLFKKVITWRIPTFYILTVLVMTAVFGRAGFMNGYPFYEIITGGVLLGAFFMATDYSTSPVTPTGQVIFAIGCGVLTSVIRLYGGYPEGTSLSILIMNLTVPLLDRYFRPRVYGVTGKKKEAKA